MTEPAIARRRGPDRLSVVLLSLTAFLLVLALLGSQLPAPRRPAPAPLPAIIRRVYVTTVVERVPAGVSAPAPRATVTHTTAPPSAPATPVATRASGGVVR